MKIVEEEYLQKPLTAHKITCKLDSLASKAFYGLTLSNKPPCTPS